MKTCVVLTGAGISADSGLKTFRDAGGLWEGHRVEDVATPEGFHANPRLVLDFYNARRRQLQQVQPNAAHFALAELERRYRVHIITQNVDNLHERAGSSQVLHLHGELTKLRSTRDPGLASAAMARASASVQQVCTCGRSMPGIGGRTGCEPVAISRRSYSSKWPSSNKTVRFSVLTATARPCCWRMPSRSKWLEALRR